MINIKTICSLLILLLLSSCSYFETISKDSKDIKQGRGEEQQLIPENVSIEPEVVIPGKEPPTNSGQDTAGNFNINDYYYGGNTAVYAQETGWRVQIFNTNSKSKAQEKKLEIEDKLGLTVYEKYEPPYFKLRVGNCATRDEAEELLDEIQDHGFKDAWIVQSKIKVSNGNN